MGYLQLKQFRLFGDFLMEGGAAMELATIFAPGAFLPLACTANLAKNLAAVAASSTRAPIYKTFALSNNLADVTAKGESVANLADIIGRCTTMKYIASWETLEDVSVEIGITHGRPSRMSVWK